MMLFDRYSGKVVSEKEIPNEIDFGRYCFVENGNDITYSNFPTNKSIKQDLLLDKCKSIQDIFIDIGVDVEKSKQNEFNVVPLIRRIKNKLNLNEFERLLLDKLFHVEEIFRFPHYLLQREIEKVHVSKAKRIPAKSYQYLASHTEDWIHKSIVKFKPSRILHEELDLNYDIYENQLCVNFVQRCLVYFNSRLKEIQDIKSFLRQYEKLLKNYDGQNSWFKRIDRNLKLIGAVYEDENYHGSSQDGATLTETEYVLNQILKRLQLLQKSELFELVNKRAVQSLSLKNTNVLVNHKHYRYIKTLWIKLDIVKTEKSDDEKLKYEQSVINGLRQYAKSIITYTLKNTLEYELNGSYKKFIAKHFYYDEIEFYEEQNIFYLKIGNFIKKIITIANKPNNTTEFNEKLKKNDCCLFYYSEELNENSLQKIPINPLDPDSIERVGIFFKTYLLNLYKEKIKFKYTIHQSLKDYLNYLPKDYLSLNNTYYTFHSYPHTDLNNNDVITKVNSDIIFQNKNKTVKKEIVNNFSILINEINSNANILKNKLLFCFGCGSIFKPFNIKNLDYLNCNNCNSILDITDENKTIFSIENKLYKQIDKESFGSDYISFNTKDL